MSLNLELIDCIPGTIVFDRIVEYLMGKGQGRAGAVTAALVFGAIFRYARMENQRCHARATIIAENAKCCVRVFYRQRNLLVRHGLIIDHNPGLRNKPHNYTITPLAYEILGVDSRARSSDFFAHLSSDSFAHLSSDSFAHEEEDHDEKIISKLNIDLPSLNVFEATYGKLENGCLARIKQLHADPLIPCSWIDEALLATAARNADNPLAYLNRVMADYKANGGPPVPVIRDAIAGEVNQVDEIDSMKSVWVEAVRRCWEGYLGTGNESKAAARKHRIIEKIVGEALNNGDIERWQIAGLDDDYITSSLAGQVDQALPAIKKPARGY